MLDRLRRFLSLRKFLQALQERVEILSDRPMQHKFIEDISQVSHRDFVLAALRHLSPAFYGLKGYNLGKRLEYVALSLSKNELLVGFKFCDFRERFDFHSSYLCFGMAFLSKHSQARWVNFMRNEGWIELEFVFTISENAPYDFR